MSRWGAVFGSGFVSLFVIGAFVYGNGAGSDSAEIASYYASSANRMHQVGGFALIMCAAVLLVLFASNVGHRLDGVRGSVAIATGSISATLLLVANCLWTASALTTDLQSGYRVDPSTHLLVEDTGFAMFIAAAAVAIPFVVAVAVDRSSPRWLTWSTVPTVAGLATSFWYFPYFAFLLWTMLASWWLLRPSAARVALNHRR